jgi:hypothetical protein
MFFHSISKWPDGHENSRQTASSPERRPTSASTTAPSRKYTSPRAPSGALDLDGARAAVRLDGAQQIDERQVLELADELLVAARARLEPIALAPLQERARVRDDLLHVERLREEVVGAGFDGAQVHLDGALGEKDERDARAVGSLLDLPAQLEAIGAALELRLRDDQIGPALGEPRRRLGGVRDGLHLESGVPEAQVEKPLDLDVTVDDEDRPTSRLLIRSRFHGERDARRPAASICARRRGAK